MTPTKDADDWRARLLDASNYPTDWWLQPSEVEAMFAQCEAGLCTTNGDTAPVTITTRQLLLLLGAFEFAE